MDMVSLKQSKNYGCGSYMRVVVLTDNRNIYAESLKISIVGSTVFLTIAN